MRTHSWLARKIAGLFLGALLCAGLFFAAEATEPAAPPTSVPKKPAGNTPPRVNAFGSPVAPNVGRSGDTFVFSFDYDDVDADPCLRCEVWIDKNDNGNYEEDEKFPLTNINPADPLGPAPFHHYQATVVVTTTSPNPEKNFRFYAFDGTDEAENPSGEYQKRTF